MYNAGPSVCVWGGGAGVRCCGGGVLQQKMSTFFHGDRVLNMKVNGGMPAGTAI